MSASQFSVKRRFISGENDWRYQSTKAPVTTSENQFIYGVKQFADPIKALGNILCSGSYYGDGSHLTGVTGSDPTKLPLTGGTLTGSLTVDAPGIISGNGSGLTGIVATDNTKLPLTGGTLTGPLTISGALAEIQVDSSSAGGVNNPLSTLNLTAAGGGSLVEEVYNQRTAVTGEFSRKSFYAKMGSTKVEYARVSALAPSVSSGVPKGRLDLSVNVNGTLSTFLSCNGNTSHVDSQRTLHLNSNSILAASSISTPSGNFYAKNTIAYYGGSGNIPPTTPEDMLRLTLINEGVPDVVTPLTAAFPGTWGDITCAADFNGYTYVGTSNGHVYYSSDETNWYSISDIFNAAIFCMATYGGYLYVGGEFSQTSGGTPMHLIARIDTGGNISQVIWNTYGSVGFNGAAVRSFCEGINGFLYIGGKFEADYNYNVYCRNVAIVDSSMNIFCIDNSSSTSASFGPDGQVYFIKEDISNPNYFILGGEFNNFHTTLGIPMTNKNAIWHSSGYDSLSSPYEVVYMDQAAVCIAQNGNQLYIGGYFSGLPNGYLVTFQWDGSSVYQVTSNPYEAIPAYPIIAVYQNGGIYWSDTNNHFFDGGISSATSPFGTPYVWIYRAIWGKLLISTNNASQNPTIAYFVDTSNVITLTLNSGTIRNGVSLYSGGTILYEQGAVVEMIYRASTDEWYVVVALNAGFF